MQMFSVIQRPNQAPDNLLYTMTNDQILDTITVTSFVLRMSHYYSADVYLNSNMQGQTQITYTTLQH